MVKRTSYAFEKGLERAMSNAGSIGEGGSAMLSALFPGDNRPLASRDQRTALSTYKSLPWLGACAQTVMNTMSAQRWRLYYKVGKNGKAALDPRVRRMKGATLRKGIEEGMASGEYREIYDHPMLDLLDAGNGELTGGQCFGLTIGYYDLTGEALWIIERGVLNQPIRYWPVPAHWVENFPGPDSPWYTIRINSWTARLPVTEAVLFRNPDPFNPYSRGIGKAPALGDELEADEYASKHLASWFKNRARPDFLVMGKMSPTDSKRLEREWIAESRGFWNAFKPRFLSGTDFQIHEMSQSFKEMGIVDLRKFNREFVAQVWGVPLEIMGVIENSNRSTIDMAEYIFGRRTIEPRMEYSREVLQERVAPLYDERLIVGYDPVVPEDKEFKLKVMERAPWAFNADEWRNFAGEDAIPNGRGQFYAVPYNLGISPDPIADAAVDEPVIPPDATIDYQDPPKKSAGRVEKIDDLTDIGFDLNEPPLLTVSEMQIIANQADPAVMQSAIRPVLTATVQAFGEAAIAEIGASILFDLNDERVLDFLARASSERITGMINETTRGRIRDTLAAGVENGEDMRAISNRVIDVFEDARGFRSLNIARTETHRAANFGAYEGYRDCGINKMQWVSTRASNNRDTHAPGAGLDGQVRPINEPFENMVGNTALYPGGFGIASEDCMCQCRVIAYFAERGLTEPTLKALWKGFIERERPYVEQMRSRVRAGFTKQQEAVLAALQRVAEKKQ